MKNTFLFLALLSQLGCKTTPPNSTPTPTPVPVGDTATTFKNPLLTVGPDPWVVYDNGYYYVMHTTGSDLRIYKTAKMSLLGTSSYKSVWSPPATPATRDVWAPELHRVNNKWYIYYSAVVAPRVNHRIWVLENESPDPMTGTWVAKGQLQLPDDSWAIDGTSVVINGQQYFAWSGWENETTDKTQNIYFCKLKDPLTPTGPRLRLSQPTLAWEKNGFPVNEGPEFLSHGPRLFLIYSGSFCGTDAYALGQITADTTAASLAQAASWTKAMQPVFGPSAANGVFGLGHNSFFQTPDGKENWIFFHANPLANQGCGDNRSPRMQPFTWNADGTPNFGQPVPLTSSQKRPSGE